MNSQIKLFNFFTRSQKVKLSLLLAFSLISSFLDFAQIALIKPFIILLGGSNNAASFEFFGFNIISVFNASYSIFSISVFLSLLVLVAMLIKVFTLYSISVYTAQVSSHLAFLAYSKSLHLPFSFYALTNSSEFSSLISVQIASTQSSLNASLSLLTNTLFLFSSLAALFYVAPYILLPFSLVIFFCYIVLGWFCAPFLNKLGLKINALIPKRLQLLEETYGSIRDVRLSRTSAYFSSLFVSIDSTIRRSMALASVFGATPRFLVESLGLLLLLCISTYLITIQKQSSAQILSSLAAFAFGAQKILPNCQQIYSSWATIKVANPEIIRLLRFLSLSEESYLKVQPLPGFQFRSLVFTDVSFSYPLLDQLIEPRRDLTYAVQSISFNIHKNARVGIIGSSGSGKSTLIDLILGNHRPDSGTIRCNGEDLHSSPSIHSSWNSIVSHVPQQIYMADQTILENVAFGLPTDRINASLIEQVAKVACLHEYILTLPRAYGTVVGENAVQLSGGQKQRLGVARALYSQPQFLILDEATSALDANTEQQLINNIFQYCLNTTILIVSHNVSTLLQCDYILELSNGCLISTLFPDSYGSLLRRFEIYE